MASRKSSRVSRSLLTHRNKLKRTWYACPIAAVTYEHLGGNSFALTATNGEKGLKVLVDPWLVGELTFGPSAVRALYSGSKKQVCSVDEALDGVSFIVLSQSLDDHAHRPTLREIFARKPDMPIVCSPAAAPVACDIGFQEVYSVPPGERLQPSGACIVFVATEGALVGPPWSQRENGFVIEIPDEGEIKRIYYEPHSDARSASLSTVGKVDTMITPLKKVTLGGFPLVYGSERVPRLVQLLKPDCVCALVNSDVETSGAISGLIASSGDENTFREAVHSAHAQCHVIIPSLGEPTMLT